MNKFLAGVLPQEGGLESAASGKYNVAIGISGLFVLFGLIAGANSIISGHHQVYAVTRDIPWGLLIAAYVFFVVTSTGLCIVSSLGHVFGFKAFNPIAKRAVFMAIITIVSGFVVIAFEIANAYRMPIWNVLGANPSSNIWWMGTLYGAYLFFMLIEFVLLQKENHKVATMFGLAGLLTGVAAHSNLGAVFGLLNGREFWHGPYMPIYFITSAAMSGCVAVIFFTYLAYKANGWKMSDDMKTSLQSVAKLGALLMSVIIFFTTWKMITGISGQAPGKYEAMMALISGSYSLNFWGGEVLLGMLIPFAIILGVKARNMPALFVASVSGMIGIFVMRYDLVVVGQIVPHFHSEGLFDYPHLFSYMPSMHEWAVTLGGLGLCAMLFLMGERMFRGHLSEDH
jgi:Ni/Fe-hydrogenase subunit HybB-like protein